MSNNGYLKLNRSPKVEWLQEHYPNAFLLLTLIAYRARRFEGHPDGLKIGEAHIGDYWKAGIESEQKYRTAKQKLIDLKIILICETCRTRKKSTTGTTTKGTLVTILNSDYWDINPETNNDRVNDRPTTDQRPTNDEQEVKKLKKKKKKDTSRDSSLIFRTKFIATSDEDHNKLVEIHGLELVNAAYQWLNDWKIEKGKTEDHTFSDIGQLRRWVFNAVREYRAREEELRIREAKISKFSSFSHNPEADKQYISQVEKDYNSKHYRLDITSSGVEFTPVTTSAPVEFAPYGPNFKKEVEHLLVKKGFCKYEKV